VKLLLISPPPGDLTQPPLGLAALSGFLRHHGFSSYDIIDSAALVIEHLLTPERLAIAQDRIARKLDHARRAGSQRPAENARFLQRAAGWLESQDLPLHVAEAKALLRDPHGFYNADRVARAVRTLKRAYGVLSAEYAPTVYSFTQFIMRHDAYSSAGIVEATADDSENPFLELLSQTVVPRMRREKPSVIGISIVYPSQMISGMTVARLAREACPEAHITVGGRVFTHLRSALTDNHPFFRWVDTFVLLDGETALLELLQRLDDGREDLSDVPNLVHKDPSGRVRSPSRLVMEQVGDLPTPDFSKMDLSRYLTPTPVLPVEASRGCFWNRCAFCNFSSLYERHSLRTPERVVGDMLELKETTGCRHFTIVDEAVPARTLRLLSQQLVEAGADVAWAASGRLSGQAMNEALFSTMRKAGCQLLYFGLESGSDRVLRLQNKGNTVASSSRILCACHDSGISTVAFFMVGFPSETASEVGKTLEFIAKHQGCLDWVTPPTRYFLSRNSPIDRDPQRFGVLRVEQNDQDLALTYRHTCSNGMSPQELRVIHEQARRRLAELGYTEDPFGTHVLLLLERQGGRIRDVLSERAAEYPAVPPRGELVSSSNRPRQSGRIVYSRMPPGLSRHMPATARHSVAAVPAYDRQLREFLWLPRLLVLLLSLCDGQRDAEALAEMVFGGGAVNRRSDIEILLERLWRMGAITFGP
jgi:anaerobic magnesium-protoporphyrin IX monomethyl ester cyclase